jgi:hypothetical protein
MNPESTEIDALGAEALPGGLAEMHLARQPTVENAGDKRPDNERRDTRRSGLADRRQKTDLAT